MKLRFIVFACALIFFVSAFSPVKPPDIIIENRVHAEGWDTLSQVRFWRRVISLTPDSSYASMASNRKVLVIFPTASYDTLTASNQAQFKDSLKQMFRLPTDSKIYVTYGKSDFYQIQNVLPEIQKASPIFQAEGVSPWYAQSILLIESPGRLRQSPTGAYGPFQLMRQVARSQGLVVQGGVDERADLKKSAQAAAHFLKTVCIPETKRMLQRRGISFQTEALWFRLLVLHVYHAGAGNVYGALRRIPQKEGNVELIRTLWKTYYRGFGNASQNYSQVALASYLELESLIMTKP